jgi:aspartyl-tRNA(Asn)/glutamyl-tRNA(Gln) amidotransferase subunit B
MEQAITFEAQRQIELIEDGKAVVQETRLYDPDRDETRPMRSKEDAQDYRYFPDPDLLPLVVTDADIERVRAAMPELPQQKRDRYREKFELPAYDVTLLTESLEKADYFERSLGAAIAPIPPKQVANWLNGDVASRLNEKDLGFDAMPVPPEGFAKLLVRVQDGTISQKAAKDVLTEMWTGKADVDAIIEAKGLKQISDAGAIDKVVDEVLAANAKQVEDYRAGKEKAFNSLVGQVMKRTQGKANPAQVNEALRRKLTG